MPSLASAMGQRVARAAHEFLVKCTGRPPAAVTVVLSDDTLVITLHEALSEAEKTLAQTPEGATQVQEFHRQLFLTSVDALRDDIRRITGVAVREAAVEIETSTGAVVHAFTSGTMVQVFQLAGGVSQEKWDAVEVQPPT
jgi:uncharacterized protein YbcI